MSHPLCIFLGEALGRYGFPGGHPFGPWRMEAFRQALIRDGLLEKACVCDPVQATQEEIERFHTHDYVEWVRAASRAGHGYLDQGDTPVFPGVYEAAAAVVGSALDAVARIMRGDCRRAFVPIGGLHHARRDAAAGFCVFNDCGVVIETLRHEYTLERVAYVDIDTHHGDGVYYGFEDAPGVCVADIHEDGRYLYPGTGRAEESGTGAARGSKLNIPLPPGAGDEDFLRAWERVESLLERTRPEFILLQCGTDSLRGDPLADLCYTPRAHGHAAARLVALAERHAQGRLLALGGGGYAPDNLARGWVAVARAMLGEPAAP